MATLTHLNSFVAHAKNVLFLVGILTATTGAIGSAGSLVAVKFLWPLLITELKSELNIATKDDLARIEHDLRELSGENRVFKMLPGTYILEPVTQGNPIEMVLAIRRTDYGLPCVFVDGTPLFTDSRDIPFPGPSLKPVKQVGTSAERLPLTLHAPTNLEPGRISLVLSMHYSCPFGENGDMVDVFEETDPQPFQMLPPVK
jgi:hypothetical protein